MTPEAFWLKVDRSAECWLWTGAHKSSGYGHLWFAGRFQLAHRVAHQLDKGPIPAGYEVDHLCGNPPCVRPDHLEAVTPQINNLRSNSLSARRARVTHCPQGHEYTPANTYRTPNNSRICRACKLERGHTEDSRRYQREWKRKQAARRAAA